MILNRIVELQAKTVVREITDSQGEYEFVENLIEAQKPPYPFADYHYLIATPFRYPLPVSVKYSGRFKPPGFGKNCFYGTREFNTAVFEYGYHWLRQRVHIPGLTQTSQPRTHFTVAFHNAKLRDIRRHPRIKKIMDRRDCSHSHQFVQKNPSIRSILYPSCRDPQKGDCVVAFVIETLGKRPETERTIYLTYDERKKMCAVECPMESRSRIAVYWEQVS